MSNKNLLLQFIEPQNLEDKKYFDFLKGTYDSRFYHYGDHFKIHVESKYNFNLRVKNKFLDFLILSFVFIMGFTAGHELISRDGFGCREGNRRKPQEYRRANRRRSSGSCSRQPPSPPLGTPHLALAPAKLVHRRLLYFPFSNCSSMAWPFLFLGFSSSDLR